MSEGVCCFLFVLILQCTDMKIHDAYCTAPRLSAPLWNTPMELEYFTLMRHFAGRYTNQRYSALYIGSCPWSWVNRKPNIRGSIELAKNQSLNDQWVFHQLLCMTEIPGMQSKKCQYYAWCYISIVSQVWNIQEGTSRLSLNHNLTSWEQGTSSEPAYIHMGK